MTNTALKFLSVVLALAAPLLANPAVEKRQGGSAARLIVRNSCPAPVNFYVGLNLIQMLPVGGNATVLSSFYTGYFFSDANGGNVSGAGSTKAGFFDNGYYYMVKDPAHFNLGMSIVPNRTPRDGLCVPATCNSAHCVTAFNAPPDRFPLVDPYSPAPTPPYYRCPENDTTYSITFCPDGGWPWPFEGSFLIKPGYGTVNKCLEVRDSLMVNGNPVQIYDCNGTPAQKWEINTGSTKVKLAGTNFCLDAGSKPGNGTGVKIWQCYDNLPAQQWHFTGDGRIALENSGLCLDLPSGNLANGKQVETRKCSDNNFNQVWSF